MSLVEIVMRRTCSSQFFDTILSHNWIYVKTERRPDKSGAFRVYRCTECNSNVPLFFGETMSGRKHALICEYFFDYKSTCDEIIMKKALG